MNNVGSPVVNKKNKILTGVLIFYLIVLFVPIFSVLHFCIVSVISIVFVLLFFPRLFYYRSLLCLLIFLFAVFMYMQLGKGLDLSINGFVVMSLHFISSALLTLSLKHLTKKQIYFVMVILLVLLLYTIIGTIVVLSIDPLAVRMYGYGVTESMSYADIEISRLYKYLGMYSYGIGEALAIITPCLLVFCLFVKKRFYACMALLIVLGSIISQMMATLTTSFILTVLFSGIVLVLFLAKTNFSVKMKVSLFIVVLLIILLPSFLELLQDNARLVQKLDDVFYSAQSGQSTGQVVTRMELFMRSLTAWLSNPFLGFANVGGVDVIKGVSLHCAVFDYLGLYGLFVLFLIFSWKGLVVFNFSLLSNKEKKYYRYGFVSLILLLLLKGPVTIATNFTFSTLIVGVIFFATYYYNKENI